MSLHSGNLPEINCTDFEKSFDEYVDNMLDPKTTVAMRRHVTMCPACDREVTRWQQTRILLSTAVADFATAVDVSSVSGDVMAALGLGAEERVERRDGFMREASRDLDRSERPARSGRDGRRSGATREAGSGRRSGISAVWRFTSAAALSAATAAAAVLLLSPVSKTAGTIVASAPSSSSSRAPYQPVTFRAGSRGSYTDVAPAAYTPPPLARPEISHVDGIEAAPGRLVSTWVQPRSNARVIWVEDRGSGAPIRTAGLDR